MGYKLAAVLLYAIVLLVIGAVASRRTRGLKDYFAGGKRLGFLAVAFSARATGESSWLLLGLTGFGAAFGAKGFWIVLGELIGVGGAWLFLSRRFKRLTDRYDSVTVPDYLESRFKESGHRLRMLAAGALLVFVPIYASAQIHATGQAFRSFLGWNYYAGALFGFAIVLIYITGGGFIAVVWSDVFQGTLMLVGLVALPLLALEVGGGLAPVLDTLRTHYPNHLTLTAGAEWNALTIAGVVGLVAIGIGFLGSPQVFVRFISLRSEAEITKGTLVAMTWTLLADSGAVLAGMFGRAVLTGDLGPGSEDVLPLLVDRHLPPFLAGLFIAVVLSAIMSTIDSLLVVASSAGVRDYYQKVFHPEMSDESLIGVSRKVTVVLAVLSLVIALAVSVVTRDQGIFWFVIFGWSGIAATFCPTLILSLFWSRMTAAGAKSAMIVGFCSVPFFKFVGPGIPVVGPYINALEELAPSFAASFLVGVVVSLLDRKGQVGVAAAAQELAEAGR